MTFLRPTNLSLGFREDFHHAFQSTGQGTQEEALKHHFLQGRIDEW